jgi:hypothetical protein
MADVINVSRKITSALAEMGFVAEVSSFFFVRTVS